MNTETKTQTAPTSPNRQIETKLQAILGERVRCFNDAHEQMDATKIDISVNGELRLGLWWVGLRNDEITP